MNINERIILFIKSNKNIILFNTISKIMKYFQFCKNLVYYPSSRDNEINY